MIKHQTIFVCLDSSRNSYEIIFHIICYYIEDGTWLKPPPSYPPIKGEKAGSDHNLDTFISMDKSEGQGDVLR